MSQTNRIRSWPEVFGDIRSALDGIKADATSQAEVSDSIKNIKAVLEDLSYIAAHLIETRKS